MNTEVMTWPLLPLAIWKAVYRDISMGKLCLPLNSCNTQESWPCLDNGQHRANTGGGGNAGELILPLTWHGCKVTPFPSPPAALGRAGLVPHLGSTVELTLVVGNRVEPTQRV